MVDGNETVVLDANHVAVANLPLFRLVHVDDAAKTIDQINAGRKRVERRLKSLRPNGLEVEGIGDPDCATDVWSEQSEELNLSISISGVTFRRLATKHPVR